MKLYWKLIIILLLVTNLVSAQKAKKYSANFIAEWAKDTASIETFTIVEKHMFGRALHLYPEPHLRQFDFLYDDNGSIKNMDIQFYDLDNTSLPLEAKTGLPYRIHMNFENGTIHFKTVDRTGEKDYIYSSNRMDYFGGWIPIISQWEWLSQLANEGRSDNDLKFVNYIVGVYDMMIERKNVNENIFGTEISSVPIKLFLDNNGNIKMVDAMGSPWNFIVHRTGPLNVEEFTKSFSNKEVMGNPSPLEIDSTQIGKSKFRLEYGRPSKRNRVVFGNVVPYGEIWRTGAGAATKFSFDSDIKIGETVIPKGTYNLFTIPEREMWHLIFNTEKNAWGSAHHSKYDLVKFKMNLSELIDPVERFTISVIDSNDNTGILKMSWDKTEATIQLKILD